MKSHMGYHDDNKMLKQPHRAQLRGTIPQNYYATDQGNVRG